MRYSQDPYRIAGRLNEISRPAEQSGSTAGTRSFSKGTALETLLWDVKSPVRGLARSPTSKANRHDAHAPATYRQADRSVRVSLCMSLPHPRIVSSKAWCRRYTSDCPVSSIGIVTFQTGNILRSANGAIPYWSISHCSLQLWIFL